MHAADTPLSRQDFETIRRLEESLWRNETRFDDASMNSLFAADFFEFGRSGKTYARADMFFQSSPREPILVTLPFAHFRARHLSPDVVQVTYVSEAVYGGQIEQGNRSSIWSRSGDGWQLRFHQGTPLVVEGAP